MTSKAVLRSKFHPNMAFGFLFIAITGFLQYFSFRCGGALSVPAGDVFACGFTLWLTVVVDFAG